MGYGKNQINNFNSDFGSGRHNETAFSLDNRHRRHRNARGFTEEIHPISFHIHISVCIFFLG